MKNLLAPWTKQEVFTPGHDISTPWTRHTKPPDNNFYPLDKKGRPPPLNVQKLEKPNLPYTSSGILKKFRGPPAKGLMDLIQRCMR